MKLIAISIPSDGRTSLEFYQGLIDHAPVARALSAPVSYQVIISAGVKLTLDPRHHERQGVTPVFAVEDLQAMKSRVESLGGRVLSEVGDIEMVIPQAVFPAFLETLVTFRAMEAEAVTPKMGVGFVAMDPAGVVMSFVQLEKWAESLFSDGDIRPHMRAEQLASVNVGHTLANS